MLGKSLFYLCVAGMPLALHCRPPSETVIEELRLELSDVKHDLHSARIEISLLEEKIAKQEHKHRPSSNGHVSEVHALEKKIAQLEKLLDKVVVDVRNLSAQTNKVHAKMQELESAIAIQEKKYDEVVQLKGTLMSISKAMGQNASTTPSKTYRVKAGDSLEKIARAHRITVESIKQLNQLSHDKIVIGQELKLFADEDK